MKHVKEFVEYCVNNIEKQVGRGPQEISKDAWEACEKVCGLTWTSEKPTVAGYYWQRIKLPDTDWFGIELVRDYSVRQPLGFTRVQWAGPIQEPKEATNGLTRDDQTA